MRTLQVTVSTAGTLAQTISVCRAAKVAAHLLKALQLWSPPPGAAAHLQRLRQSAAAGSLRLVLVPVATASKKLTERGSSACLVPVQRCVAVIALAHKQGAGCLSVVICLLEIA